MSTWNEPPRATYYKRNRVTRNPDDILQEKRDAESLLEIELREERDAHFREVEQEMNSIKEEE